MYANKFRVALTSQTSNSQLQIEHGEETDTKPELILTASDPLSVIDEPTLNSERPEQQKSNSTRGGQNHRTLSSLNQHNAVPTSAKRGPIECQLCVHKP